MVGLRLLLPWRLAPRGPPLAGLRHFARDVGSVHTAATSPVEANARTCGEVQAGGQVPGSSGSRLGSWCWSGSRRHAECIALTVGPESRRTVARSLPTCVTVPCCSLSSDLVAKPARRTRPPGRTAAEAPWRPNDVEANFLEPKRLGK